MTLECRVKTLTLAMAVSLASSAWAQKVTYYHLDAIGNVRAVTDASGTPIERHDYLPFGEECVSGPCASNPGVTSAQPRHFIAKERDVETGLDYFGGRYYAAPAGRFTTTDPVTQQESLSDPQRWNRYAYGRDNPLRYLDPDGRALLLPGRQSSRDQAMALANAAMFGHKLSIDPSDSVAALEDTSDIGPPSPTQYALAETLRLAIEDQAPVTIGLVEHSPAVVTGNWENSTIDVSDMAMFGSGPGLTAAGKFGHEVREQYLKQALCYVDEDTAHRAAIAAESRITGWIRDPGDSVHVDTRTLSGTVIESAHRGRETMRFDLTIRNGDITRIDRQ
jgi:RHS repeat-associated protein